MTSGQMTSEQSIVLNEIEQSDAKVLSKEMIGDVLTIKLNPNLLCVVERDGKMAVSTIKKGSVTE